MTQGFLITNNPAVRDKYAGRIETAYLENKKLIDVMYFARDKIHEGHRLLTHPLSGSVKPWQTPYKSIVITKEKGGLDIESLRIIEGGLAAANKYADREKEPLWSEEVLKDFQLIDLELIAGGDIN